MPTEFFDIRPFLPGDLDRIMATERECYSHPWSREMFLEETRNPFSSLDLLWLGEEMAGYLCSWMIAGELHILNVATAPRFRRRGVAATLLRHAIDGAYQHGLARAFLEVRVCNEGAIALYLAFGFRIVYRRCAYYPDGEDAFVMEWLVSDKGPAPSPYAERKDV